MIGTIEVVRHSTSFLRNEYRYREDIDFDQANKKDANEVTGGEHIMSTTKKGRLLEQVHPSQRQEMKTIWTIGGELGRLSVEYHMGHTLQVSVCVPLLPQLRCSFESDHISQLHRNIQSLNVLLITTNISCLASSGHQ